MKKYNVRVEGYIIVATQNYELSAINKEEAHIKAAELFEKDVKKTYDFIDVCVEETNHE